MIDSILSLPAPLAIVLLTFIVFFRAQGTYWLGRALVSPRSRILDLPGLQGLKRWFAGPSPKKGAALLESWGLIIIPLCFLTVGIQTAVNAGAGIVRLNWRSYTLAMLPGCVLWGTLYGLGFLALWQAAFLAFTGSVWGLLALGVLLAIFTAYFIWQRKRRRQIMSATAPLES